MDAVAILPSSPRLTINDAATGLGLHRTTVLKLIHSGQLRAIKVGRRWETYQEWIDEYLLSRQNVLGDSPTRQRTITIATTEAELAEGLARHGVKFAD